MVRPALTRTLIVATCIQVLDHGGAEKLTLRRLGDELGADPTAIYRHFRDKDELLRAVGDELIRDVCVDLPADDAGWRAVMRELCARLRAAYVGHPGISALVQSGPPMQDNELRLTEEMLRQLRRSGLDAGEAAMAYHACIELTVGGAVLDSSMAAHPPAERQAAYRRWRATYATLDETAFPDSVAAAPHLYVGTADDRFAYALDRLLDGLEAKARATAARR